MTHLAIWHGYLLGGTGSNVYTAHVAPAWRAAGRDVILMCQEREWAKFEWIDCWVYVTDGEQTDGCVVRERAAGEGSVTMVQADLGGLLPVYLLDRYPGFAEVKRFVDATDAEIERYMHANALAMQWVLDRCELDGVLVNHAVMGPESVRETLVHARVPYAVKIHGSELEYAIAERPDRFTEPARSGLLASAAVLSGSAHIARRVDELLGADASAGRMHILPPGVDLEHFRPLERDRPAALAALANAFAELERTSAGRAPEQALSDETASALETPDDAIEALARLRGAYQEREVEHGTAAWLRALPPDAPLVSFVGKLIHQKGIQLLVCAWPLVLQRVPDARLAVVGFGLLREPLDLLVRALSGGDMGLVQLLIEAGDRLDDGEPQEFAYLADFFDGLETRDELDAYLACARELPERIAFTGPVDHAILALLWPLCAVSTVPSIAAEAFGMVSAEAAACGCPPLVSDHSGLADVADVIADHYPSDLRRLVRFGADTKRPAVTDNTRLLTSVDPVRELAETLITLLTLAPGEHAQLADAARAAVVANWSWDSIAARIEALFHES